MCPKEGHVFCKDCNMCFCISHRYVDDHECKVFAKKEEAKQSASNEVSDVKRAILDKIADRAAKDKKSKGSNTVMTDKQKSINAKVARMKVKSKAVGDNKVAKEHRFAVKLVFELNDANEETLQFFHGMLKVGQVIDLICKERKIV